MTPQPNIDSPQGSPTLVKENGELSLHFSFPTIQSRTRIGDPVHLVLDYTRTMMGFLLFHPNPSRIAMIGLGGGSLAKYCYYLLPNADFTAIELSLEVIGLRKEFAIPDDDERFRIVCDDGANHVRHNSDSVDVLLVDGFSASGQPEQLCSQIFYDDCHTALRPGGILAVNLCTDDDACDCYVSRINQSFAGKMVVADADEGENKIVFACKGGAFPPSFSTLTERLRTLEVGHAVNLDLTAQKILQYGQRIDNRRRRR